MAAQSHRPVVASLALVALTLLTPDLARSQAGAGAPASLPSPREIPGLTAADAFPGGCVDCHLRYPDQGLDVRFSTLLSGWAREVEPPLVEAARASSRAGVTLVGRHPEVAPDVLTSIPARCIGCHARRPDDAPDMTRLTHLVHLRGGTENVFLTVFGGECTHCHKLDASLGMWTVPTGPERAEGDGG